MPTVKDPVDLGTHPPGIVVCKHIRDTCTPADARHVEKPAG